MLAQIRYRLALVGVTAVTFVFLSRLAIKTPPSERFSNFEPPEVILELRPYPEDGHPWYQGDAIQVRPDIRRLRAHNISIDQLKEALTESGFFRLRPVVAPPEVVFCGSFGRADQYEKVLVKATPDGEIVRVKDVATVKPAGGGEWSRMSIGKTKRQ